MSKRITVTISDNAFDTIRLAADRYGWSLSRYIRLILERFSYANG